MRKPVIHRRHNKQAWTLAEMIMVLSLVSMLFMIILPQFRLLYKSWDLKEASAETRQHGRILLDHLQRELSSARAVSAMSDPGQTLGSISYLNASNQSRRYEVGAGNYVYFGAPGDLSLLAGPVSRFQIAGYAANDLLNPTLNVSAVRLVRIQSVIESPTLPGKTDSFTFSACIRASEEPFVIRLLFVVANPPSLSTYEQRLYNQFQSWGYTITLIDDHALQAAYDAAVLTADVAYVPASCGCLNLSSKLTMAPIGVVNEHLNCHDDLRYASAEGGFYTATAIRVIDNTHPITSSYLVNQNVTVVSASGSLVRISGTAAGGLRILARRPGLTQTSLAVIEIGGLLQSGLPAPARRVTLPWGTTTFNNGLLNAEGWEITRRSIEWAAGAL